MTPPSSMSILLFVIIVAAIYKISYWRADHPRKVAAPPEDVSVEAVQEGVSP